MGVLLIATGGTVGVLARYGLQLWFQSIWTVAGINLVGSFMLGLLLHLDVRVSHEIRNGLGVGFLGGFTTLSTLTTQTVLEADAGRAGLAAVYLLTNVIGGLAAAATGYAVGRAVAG